ncbi:MAG: dTMP kinase [Alteromonadaceae bacterium]|nr:MAG: dTMP kinase [Alteromonadaceae bacterium]
MKGKFVTVEGGEGVGKTTNISFIKQRLEDAGHKVLLTREPGGTPLSEELREILLAKREEAVDPSAELLLVFAARAQHLNSVIIPAINRGEWVLCDRFTDATYAYQGYGRGLSVELVMQLESLVQGDIRPDKTFYLDLDVEIGLKRASARASLDRFESEDMAFFRRVREGYLARVNMSPDRYYVIDASQSLEGVQASISARIAQLLEC